MISRILPEQYDATQTYYLAVIENPKPMDPRVQIGIEYQIWHQYPGKKMDMIVEAYYAGKRVFQRHRYPALLFGF